MLGKLHTALKLQITERCICFESLVTMSFISGSFKASLTDLIPVFLIFKEVECLFICICHLYSLQS